MSRSIHPRGRWRHSRHQQWPKREGNRWERQEVRQRLKDILFTDAFDEEGLPERKEGRFDRWYYCD